MKRIMIVGQPGSGKSTLAQELGGITHLPVVHMDQIHWKSGWVERDKAEKDALCAKAHAEDKWIFEGGHSATWPERLDRADMLIWLDVPLALRLWRILWRGVVYHGKTRPDLPERCPERLDPAFLRWIWTTRRTSRTKMQELFDTAPQYKSLHHLSSNKDVADFLAALRTAAKWGNLGISHR
jgi:adenylate kinase family enzyme